MRIIFKKSRDLHIDENIIKKNRIPILIQDKEWREIVGVNYNKTIQYLSKELETLLRERKDLTNELGKNRAIKTKLMNKILHLSDLINTKGQENVVPELERSQAEIIKLNDSTDEITEKLEAYPWKIEEVNLAILKETINIIYNDIKSDYSKLQGVDEEISVLREKLGPLRDEKEALERKVGALYSFLHTFIGHKEMEKLDLHFFNE